MTQPLLLIELNEINFEFVQNYARQGELPTFARLIETHGLSETTSEQAYEDWEPWIQWVTCHTGLSLDEHKVFRLGDIMKHDIPQIWEQLEERGLRVGAVSPMNAKNRTRAAAFFVPDPWTRTAVTGPFLLRKLYDAVAQAVNDNASSRLTAGSAAWLASGMLRYARPVNYSSYGKLLAESRSKPWSRACLLDLLLSDIFIGATRRSRPDFASLFLNAGAHIQHHYLFSSSVYTGSLQNPAWYIRPGDDPLLEIYRLYDRMLRQIREGLPEYRLMIATGLHQDPHPDLTFYWRLKNHEAFLNKIGVPFAKAEPRMSRDFLVTCADANAAAGAARVLESAIAADGTRLFDVDNRGSDLFVMLTYPNDIGDDFEYRVGNQTFRGLRDDVAFVAIKNGEHNGIGYFIDTGTDNREKSAVFPLKNLPDRIKTALAA